MKITIFNNGTNRLNVRKQPDINNNKPSFTLIDKLECESDLELVTINGYRWLEFSVNREIFFIAINSIHTPEKHYVRIKTHTESLLENLGYDFLGNDLIVCYEDSPYNRTTYPLFTKDYEYKKFLLTLKGIPLKEDSSTGIVIREGDNKLISFYWFVLYKDIKEYLAVNLFEGDNTKSIYAAVTTDLTLGADDHPHVSIGYYGIGGITKTQMINLHRKIWKV